MGCFVSRLPPSLTPNEIDLLKSRSNLKDEDIDRWYSRFIHCYPNGYLTENEFIDYYQQLHEVYSLQLQEMLKEFFPGFDLNKDQKLDFSEFILFNVLVNDGTIDEKMEFLFRLYDENKTFSKNELKEFLRNFFYLFDIPSSKYNLIHIIDRIYQENSNLPWKSFTNYLLNHRSSYEELLTPPSSRVIHFSERF